MKVLFTTDISSYGNDCYINESVSLVECFGMYAVVMAEKVSGWYPSSKIYCLTETTSNFEEAKSMFKEAGGKFE